MAKNEDDPDGTHEGGGKGGVKITEGYLADFAEQKLAWLIHDFDFSEPRLTVRNYTGTGKEGGGVNHLLAGTSVGNNTSPGSLITALGTYAGALDAYFKELSRQAIALREDLKHASRALGDGHDGALTAAQLMWLIDDVLKGGGTGGGAGGGTGPH
ncbi:MULTISPECIES: hypothetical protein [Kitasatospora]|uniref:Uncharacterized protein n=1 Tax=Kitasatospora setae (strain ATCC 33774 / DSM 43861 / JCM 3304 / KCC A-0304 / NBRC 14216 / KM-6054) TaxID=452652 RepID=E4N3J5_KITSK|nr:MULTISPECIES: hypothetical protein [Kitasatospora]BAJ32729.1 hypothetical protein KSE_69710 [Kitasatospora setae KM-6054]